MTDIPEIDINSLVKSFKNHRVLNDVTLQVKKGESLVIVGASGSGKSVLIKTIIGLLRQNSGTAKIKGEEISKLSDKEKFVLLTKCGYLFQGGALFDSLTIQENILFFTERLKKLTKKEKLELASTKLEEVGLTPRLLKMYPSELSGGMQKRVALARTICSEPEIMFFDEPTTGLDPIMSNIITDLIIKATNKLGATTITITHDMSSAHRIANSVALLYDGKIVWRGSKEDLNSSNNQYLEQFIKGSTVGPMQI